MISADGLDIFAEQIKGNGEKKENINYRNCARDAHQSLMATNEDEGHVVHCS